MDLPTIVETVHPELIVLADSPECDAAVERLLEIPRRRFRVVGLLSFYQWAFGRVPVPYLTPSWFMSLIHLRQRVSARWSKRTFDVALASFALVVLAPVLLVIALLVATTAGPIIFRQTRIGERGRLLGSTSSGRCAPTRKAWAGRSGPVPAILAPHASADCCGARTWTSFRSC